MSEFLVELKKPHGSHDIEYGVDRKLINIIEMSANSHYKQNEKRAILKKFSLQNSVKDHSIKIEMLLEKLSSIRQENAMLKFTLSELVDKSVMSDFLSKAEIIHNELIANDESLLLLISSATQIFSNLKSTSMRDSVPCVIKQQQLQDDFKIFETRFTTLKKRFNAEMLTKID